MESKYRKLYLYASNTQAIAKKSTQSQDQYALKKKKSIEQLKQLLDIKIGLPSLHSINGSQVDSNDQNNNKPDKYVVKKPKLKQKTSTKAYYQFSLPAPNKNSGFQIVKPKVYQYPSPDRAKIAVEQRQKKYQRYINQYMQKIQKEKILQKIPEEDYKILIQEACRQIRRRIIQDQYQIQQVQKGLQESNENQLLKSRRQSINKARRKNNKQIKKIFKNQDSTIDNYTQIVPDRLIFRRDHHRKSKSLADNNIYKFNLQMVQKVNELKNRQRRRSQKQFVRNLGKFSLFFNKNPQIE